MFTTFLYLIFVVDASESTIGRDFILGFVNNFRTDVKLLIVISNANDQPTNVIVTSIYQPFRSINAIIKPNTVDKVNIEKNIQCLTFLLHLLGQNVFFSDVLSKIVNIKFDRAKKVSSKMSDYF